MDNKVANVFLVVGTIQIVLGIIIGLRVAGEYYFDWGVIFMWTGIGAVTGIFTIGFAQVIELLHHINLKLGDSSEKVGNGEE